MNTERRARTRDRHGRGILAALRGTSGAIDLASVMVGVLVIGIIGGVISASVFAVIPWAQNESAKEALGAVRTAESVAVVKDDGITPVGFQSSDELVRKKLIQASTEIVAGTSAKRDCFVAVSRSATGSVFFTDDRDATAKDYVSGSSQTDYCTDLSALVSTLPSLSGAVALPRQTTVLDQIGSTAQTSASAGGGSAIERGHVQSAMANVRAKFRVVTALWADTTSTTVPASVNDFSVGFDNAQGSASGLPESFGLRGAAVTRGDNNVGYAGVVFTLSGQKIVCSLSGDYNTAAALLASVGADMSCPGVAPVSTTSAITSMWAWGNSVDPAADNRGHGQMDMTPAAVTAFASSHGLTTVFVSTPWAANQGALGSWLSDTVTALHSKGIKVAALGGDPTWVDNPALAGQWITDARAAASFDAVELDVEPWAGSGSVDAATFTPKLVTMLDTVRAAAGPLTLGMDTPWWLAEAPYSGANVIDTLLPHLDSVVIVAFANHAAASDGIIALAAPAVKSVVAAGKPFTIGVETDTPAVAGGAQFTFYDSGNTVMQAETAKVRTAFSGKASYQGVTVEHMRAWATLKN